MEKWPCEWVTHVANTKCTFFKGVYWGLLHYFISYFEDEDGDQKCVLSLLVVLFKKDKSDLLCRIYEKTQVC